MKSKNEKPLGPKITLYDLVREVIKLAKLHPKNVYDNGGPCKYASGKCSNGTEGCIIGQALRNLGFDVEAIDNNSNCATGIDSILYYKLRSYIKSNKKTGLKYSKFLHRIQSLQDAKTPWGKAYEQAKFHLKVENNN